jgi:hypothetical protein
MPVCKADEQIATDNVDHAPEEIGGGSGVPPKRGEISSPRGGDDQMGNRIGEAYAGKEIADTR